MKWLKRLHEWGNKHEWILILLLAVVILRIPSLLTPHYYGDEEIYFVMGRAWREGIPMYQAMFDHKPPLLYILAGIANNVFWFRTMLMGAMLVHTYLFYRLASLVFAKTKTWHMYLSTAVFTLLTSLPLLEGNIANAELFMMVPVTASILILWPLDYARGKQAKNTDYIKIALAGLLAGVGWLFKVPVVMDVLAIGLYLYVFRPVKFRDSLRAVFSRPLWIYLICFAIPLLSTFVYYYLKGNGQSYLDTVLTMNLGYVSSWSTSSYTFNPFKSGLFVRGLVVLLFSIWLYICRNRLPKRMTLPMLWLAFSFFGALLSGRPYPHYLMQPVVPFALALPYIFIAENFYAWTVIGLLSIWGIFTNREIKFWGYPTIPYYRDFAQYALGKIDKKTYDERFDGVKRNYAIGKYLNEHMNDSDKLYLWGSDAAIYNITDKLPAGGKYIVNFHVADLHKHDYVISNLNQSKPKYIVTLPKTTPFPQLDQLIILEYQRVYEYDGTQVFMRLPQ